MADASFKTLIASISFWLSDRRVVEEIGAPSSRISGAVLAAVLVEQVFSYPGLGQCAVTAGLGSDLPLLLGITVVSAAIVFGGNLAADLLYGVVDPKIRRGAART